MMKETTVSGRYARALFLLTEKQQAKLGAPFLELLQRSLDELRGLAGIAGPGTRLGDFLSNPQVRITDKRALLAKGLEGRTLPSVRVFADLLLRKKRLVLVGEIAREFQVLVERAQGLQRATVVSATPLTDAERKTLHERLQKSTGKKIVLDAAVDRELIGGAYVRIGDRVVDRSVRTLLQSIGEQLYETSV
jgi:F-type H+-transporting ATPase subunit delta